MFTIYYMAIMDIVLVIIYFIVISHLTFMHIIIDRFRKFFINLLSIYLVILISVGPRLGKVHLFFLNLNTMIYILMPIVIIIIIVIWIILLRIKNWGFLELINHFVECCKCVFILIIIPFVRIVLIIVLQDFISWYLFFFNFNFLLSSTSLLNSSWS